MNVVVLAMGVVLVAVAVAVVVVTKLIEVCGPGELLILTGHRSTGGPGYRLLMGGRTVRLPFLERVDRLSLANIAVDISLRGALSRGCVPLDVEAVANVRIARHQPVVNKAIECLLDWTREEIEAFARDTLQAVLHAVLAGLMPEQVREDPVALAQLVAQEAEIDLDRVGLEVDSLKIQRVSDRLGYLDALAGARAVGRTDRRFDPVSAPRPAEPSAPEPLATMAPPPGSSPSWEELVEDLARGRRSIEEVARAVQAGGDPWIERCVSALAEFGVRDRIKEVLSAVGGMAVVHLLGKLGELTISFEAKELLVQIGPAAHDPILAELEGIRDQGVLEGALDVLARTGLRHGQEAIAPLLHHDSFTIRHKAEQVLREIGLGQEEIRTLQERSPG